jgi:hypothetical protein
VDSYLTRPVPGGWAVPVGTAAGAAAGVTLGLLFQQIALGIVLGAAFGVVTGAAVTAAAQLPETTRHRTTIIAVTMLVLGATLTLALLRWL